jgi:predicted nucleic acid-binding protein
MIPLRLVLDTNIIVPARLYVNEAIIAEHASVLARPDLKIRKALRQQLLQLIKSRGYRVAATKRLQVTPDPDDNIFLECVDAARADYLVTRNQRHFPRFWGELRGSCPASSSASWRRTSSREHVPPLNRPLVRSARQRLYG